MDKDPAHTLIAQFSNFIVDKQIGEKDWKMLTTEYMVHEYAEGTFRFFRSWDWGDDDRDIRTLNFLKTIYKRDEETTLALMKRMYDLAGGADKEELQKYPALQSLEGERTDIAGGLPTLTVTTKLFLNIENIPDSFYGELINNINKCYRIGVYDGTLVLTRKLLENQIIDLLRKECEDSEVEVYFIPERGQFRSFRRLLEEFEYRIDDFKSYSGGVDKDLINEIERIKGPADSQAHSIEDNVIKDDVDNLRNDVEHAVKVLFRVFRNMD